MRSNCVAIPGLAILDPEPCVCWCALFKNIVLVVTLPDASWSESGVGGGWGAYPSPLAPLQ